MIRIKKNNSDNIVQTTFKLFKFKFFFKIRNISMPQSFYWICFFYFIMIYFVKCPRGKIGYNCSQTCPSGYFGQKYNQKCQCSSNEHCDPVSGCLEIKVTVTTETLPIQYQTETHNITGNKIKLSMLWIYTMVLIWLFSFQVFNNILKDISKEKCATILHAFIYWQIIIG